MHWTIWQIKIRILFCILRVKITVSDIELSNNKVAIGNDITFSFTITSKETDPCKLMIDYSIYYMKAKGKQSPKVLDHPF